MFDSFVESNIYYLNISELKKVAAKYDIPIYVYLEQIDGTLKKSNMIEKKKEIIKKIINLLKYDKKPKKAIIKFKLINYDQPSKITAESYIYFGQYKNGNKLIYKLMKRLTNDKFEFGVIAQNILYRSWIKGKLMTYGQLAKKWLKDIGNEEHPEWQYIEFVRSGNSIKDWKRERYRIAQLILEIIKI
jgi:hypothetical protein